MNVETFTTSRRDERRLLRHLLAGVDQPVVYDVGANVGQFLTMVVEECPHATVVSFEPNPVSFAKLQETATRLGTTAENLGLGATAGEGLMFDRAEDPGSTQATLVSAVMDEIHHAKSNTVAVQIETLDRYARTRGIEAIDFLKIDVEGFELEVLQGAASLIAERRIAVIQLEFNNMNVLTGSFVKDFMRALPDFEFFRLLGDGTLYPIQSLPTVARELFGYQNLIAIATS